MFCNYCGQENPDNARFCASCGKPQGSNAPAFEEARIIEQPPDPVSAAAAGEFRLWEAFGSAPTIDFAQPISSTGFAQPISSTGEIAPQQPILTPLTPIEVDQPEMDQLAVDQRITAPLPVIDIIRTPWTRALEPRFGVPGKRLPVPAIIGGIVVVALLLVVLQVTGSDWAAGAKSVAVAAGIIALLVILATGVRTLAGMRGRRHFIFAGINVLILIALCIAGLTQQSSIHYVQGNFLEGQKQWQSAIMEYQLAGQQAPTSNSIARTYDEWGEQFSTANQYKAAIDKFNIVLNNYSAATSEVTRAQSDEIAAYLALGNNNLQQRNYTAAAMSLDTLLTLPFCNSSCQMRASALDATAYYNTGEVELGSQQYSEAVSTFQLVLSRFPASPEAQKLHPDFARALLGQGQEQLTSDCSSAIPTYQQLMQSFADTPQGQQAIKALQAPQPIKGHFVGFIPQDPSLTPVAILAKNMYGGMPSAQFAQAINGAPAAPIGSDGTFIFKPQRQGVYDLVWGSVRNTGSSSFSFSSYSSSGQPVYVATVGPLCAFNFNDINENIPTAP